MQNPNRSPEATRPSPYRTTAPTPISSTASHCCPAPPFSTICPHSMPPNQMRTAPAPTALHQPQTVQPGSPPSLPCLTAPQAEVAETMPAVPTCPLGSPTPQLTACLLTLSKPTSNLARSTAPVNATKRSKLSQQTMCPTISTAFEKSAARTDTGTMRLPEGRRLESTLLRDLNPFCFYLA